METIENYIGHPPIFFQALYIAKLLTFFVKRGFLLININVHYKYYLHYGVQIDEQIL
jgi:hypothetical protein